MSLALESNLKSELTYTNVFEILSIFEVEERYCITGCTISKYICVKYVTIFHSSVVF